MAWGEETVTKTKLKHLSACVLIMPEFALTCFILVAISLSLPAASLAGYDEGIEAYRFGDYETAMAEWVTAAKRGDAKSEYMIGQLYSKGEGHPRDYKEAVKWYRKAANKEHGRSMHQLGFMYETGVGVKKKYSVALNWYRKAEKSLQQAATQGHAAEQQSLGSMYSEGRGVPRDYAEAVKWFRKAANQDYARGQVSLGNMYESGKGVPQDWDEAERWYRKAAEQGDSWGIWHLRYLIGEKFDREREKKREERASIERTPEYYERLYQKLLELEDDEPEKRKQETEPRPAKKSTIEKAPPLGDQKQLPKAHPKQNVPKKTPNPQSSSGSGFFISKSGHVVTNAHVVQSCEGITVGDGARKQSPAEIVSIDKKNDLALLKLSSLEKASKATKALVRKLEIKLVPLAADGLLRADDVELGEKLLVAGYPYGNIFSNAIKVTGGIVSAVRGVGDNTGQFQLDAAVQPGNSGGPIYDENGNIVGVVVAQLNKLTVAEATGSLPENVNFGIKASTVKLFLVSSGLLLKQGKRTKPVPTKQLAKVAKKQTLMVQCHR